jgi:RND family efflux transporter MFP subunit
LALALSACGDKASANKAPPPVAVLELAHADVAIVQKSVLKGGLPIAGVLQAVTQTTVQSRVAAEVDDVLVREGEDVRKGQILAHLGTKDLDARLKQAEANLASAKVEAQLANALLERNQKLYEKNYFSEIDYQRSEGDAEARAANARAQQALVDIARKALNDANIKAPMDGIIARRYVEPGSSISMDGRLFDIVDLTEMELAAPVPATEIAAVKPGQMVQFTVSGFGDTAFSGKVVRINPVADAGTRAITVYVHVDNSQSTLKGGMYARGDILLDDGGEALLIPLEALHEEPGQLAWVMVLRQGRIEKRIIDPGTRDERHNQLAVRSGLAEGEMVIVTQLGDKAINQPARINE